MSRWIVLRSYELWLVLIEHGKIRKVAVTGVKLAGVLKKKSKIVTQYIMTCSWDSPTKDLFLQVSDRGFNW